MKRLLPAFLIAISISTLALGLASANAKPTINNGLSISPAIEQVNLSKGQSSVTFNSKVTNNSTKAVVVELTTSDFTALGNNGNVAFLSGKSTGSNLHGLKGWLNPDLKQIVLAPNTTQAVPISIINTASLAPGGHYGAIIYRVLPLNPSVKGNSLSTNEELSMLVFLTTSSGSTQSVQLYKPQISPLVSSLPSTIDLYITNTGNTQTSPVGLVTITNNSHKEIAQGIINADSGLVLPATGRLYEVALNYKKKTLYPGSYQVNISYRASSLVKAQTYTSSIFLINKSLILLTALVIAALLIFIIRKLGKTHTIYKFKA